jgi:hypothetical protein
LEPAGAANIECWQAFNGFPTGFFMNDDSLGNAPDPSLGAKSMIAQVSETVKSTAHTIGDAIESGRSNIAREAPLGSLLVAFLLGVAVARRRLGQATE